jgi:hypothetical protein
MPYVQPKKVPEYCRHLRIFRQTVLDGKYTVLRNYQSTSFFMIAKDILITSKIGTSKNSIIKFETVRKTSAKNQARFKHIFHC